jgi:hypothetical protein
MDKNGKKELELPNYAIIFLSYKEDEKWIKKKMF